METHNKSWKKFLRKPKIITIHRYSCFNCFCELVCFSRVQFHSISLYSLFRKSKTLLTIIKVFILSYFYKRPFQFFKVDTFISKISFPKLNQYLNPENSKLRYLHLQLVVLEHIQPQEIAGNVDEITIV